MNLKYTLTFFPSQTTHFDCMKVIQYVSSYYKHTASFIDCSSVQTWALPINAAEPKVVQVETKEQSTNLATVQCFLLTVWNTLT